ncbi:MAG: hypothetical protein Q9164_002954 [Protoblastenia rupestris]
MEKRVLSKEDLIELCFNFLVYDGEMNTFRFAHLSVRDFLEEKAGFDQASCHTIGATQCLRHLSTDAVGRDLVIEVENSDLSGVDTADSLSVPWGYRNSDEYALFYWAYHLSLSEKHRIVSPLYDLALNFLLPQPSSTSRSFYHWIADVHRLRIPRRLRNWTYDMEEPFDLFSRKFCDACRLTQNDTTSFTHGSRIEKLEFADPIFAISVWNFWDLLKIRIQAEPKSINLESIESTDSHVTPEHLNHGSSSKLRPLDLACFYGSYESAKILLEAGVQLQWRPILWKSPVCTAIRRNDIALVRLLLEHHAPLCQSFDAHPWDGFRGRPRHFEMNPLHLAALYASPAIVRMLLDHSADPNMNISGTTPLDCALERRDSEISTMLANALSPALHLTVDETDLVGRLFAAIYHQDINCLSQLLGQKMREEKFAKYLDTALHKAAAAGSEEMARLLLLHGANINSIYQARLHVESRERGCNTFGAALSGPYSASREPLVRLLLDAGANPNAPSPNGETSMLDIAVSSGVPELVNLMLEAGANPNIFSSKHNLLLEEVVAGNNTDIAKLLLLYGATPNSETSVWGSCLDMALENDNPAMVELLIEWGAISSIEGQVLQNQSANFEAVEEEPSSHQSEP